MNRESLVFCVAALAVALGVCALGFRLAALPRATIEAATRPAPAESLPDVDVGGGFGRVPVIDLVGYYIENPPAPAGAGGDAPPAVRRFGGC